MSIKLSFNAGSLKGKLEEFSQGKITIGRGSDNNLRFDPKTDLDASKNHAVITLEDGAYWLEDLGSTNGTYVNGKKITRVKLNNGDDIEFGKGGPRSSVQIALPGMSDTSPKTRVSQAVDQGRGVGSQTVAMMIEDALQKAKSSDRGAIGGTAVFIKEAVNNALKKSSRTFKVVTSFFILALIGAIVFLVMQGKEVKDDLQQAQQETAEARAETERITSEMASSKDKLYNLIETHKQSVAFVYSRFDFYDDNGKFKKSLESYGTGFFVRDDGYLVTCKHIVYPWKFQPEWAYEMELSKSLDLRVDHFLSVWVNGVRFRAGGKYTFENSYNTRDGNLEIFTTAEDRMYRPKRNPDWVAGINVEVHERDNNDIAILKAIGGTFKSVKIYRGRDPYKVADTVMVYGFPLGISPQELANTNASPSFGRIRKIENTIQLDVSVLPGNSGGPIFTEDGYVIGVMTRRFAETLNEGIMIEHAARLVPGL